MIEGCKAITTPNVMEGKYPFRYQPCIGGVREYPDTISPTFHKLHTLEKVGNNRLLGSN